MSSLVFYFLACLMSMTTVSSLKMLPAVVNHPDRQCILRRFLGACTYLEPQSVTVNCNNMECAGPLRANTLLHRAVSTGRAARGTHCGRKKVCYNGDCIDLPPGATMPRQILKNDEGFICYRPNSGASTSGHFG